MARPLSSRLNTSCTLPPVFASGVDPLRPWKNRITRTVRICAGQRCALPCGRTFCATAIGIWKIVNTAHDTRYTGRRPTYSLRVSEAGAEAGGLAPRRAGWRQRTRSVRAAAAPTRSRGCTATSHRSCAFSAHAPAETHASSSLTPNSVWICFWPVEYPLTPTQTSTLRKDARQAMSAASGPSIRSQRTQSTSARPVPRVGRVIRLEGDEVRLVGVVASLNLSDVGLLDIASGRRGLVHERPRVGRAPRARHSSETQRGECGELPTTSDLSARRHCGPRRRVNPQPSSLPVCTLGAKLEDQRLEATDGDGKRAGGEARSSPGRRVLRLAPAWTCSMDPLQAGFGALSALKRRRLQSTLDVSNRTRSCRANSGPWARLFDSAGSRTRRTSR